MNRLPVSVVFACALVGALAAPALRAQSAAPAATGEETIKLTTFEVSSKKDYGYCATNSITATGIGTEIFKTPINVSVVTRDLIQDIGATSLRETLGYTANVLSDRRDPNSVISRGFAAPVLINRNAGGARNPVPDFIERVEVVKGPNAVFFGRVSPSGVLNLITLQPKSVTESAARVTYGSYDQKQVFIEHNQKLGDHAAVRFAGSYFDRGDGYIDFTYRRQDAGYVAATWDILPNLKLNVTGTTYDGRENVIHSVPRGHPGYRAYTQANPGATLTIQQWQAAFIPGQPYMTVYLDPYESFTNGWQGNNNGPDAYKADRGSFVQPELIYTAASWLTLRAAGSFNRGYTQTLETSGFPSYNGTFITQRPAFNGGRSLSQIGELEAVFTFDTGPATHRLLLGGRAAHSRNGFWAVSNAFTIPLTWNNRTQGPRHIIRDSFVGGVLPGTPYFAMPRSEETGLYAIDQIGFFKDRVKLLAGARTTEVTNIGATAATVGPDRSQKETTPQFGALVEVVKGVVLFANTAKTFEPQFNVDARGNLANNIHGKGTEAGLKLDLQDSVWSGTVSWFKLERSGEVRRDFSTEVSTGISPLFVPGGTKRSEGADVEVFFTPVRNYQAILSYTYIWDAKAVTDIGAPAIVGRRLERTPEHMLSVWNKYTFTTGATKGLSIGVGVRHVSQVDTLLDPNFNLKNDPYTETNASIGYGFKLGRRPVTVQLNVKNLLDQTYLDGNFTPADPRTYFLTLGTKF